MLGLPTDRASVRVHLHRIDGGLQRSRGEPVTFGLPLPRGLEADVARLSMCDGRGSIVPLQARVLNRWSDGSIRWVLVDFSAHFDAGQDPLLQIRFGHHPGDTPVRPASAVEASPEGNGLVIDTGAARFTLAPGPRSPLTAVTVDGRSAQSTGQSGFSAEDAHGQSASVRLESVTLEESGPLRAVVVATGHIVMEKAALDLDVRLHFFAGSATARFAVTARNPRPARHPGGFWELGDPGSVLFRDLSFCMALPEGTRATEGWWSESVGTARAFLSLPFELYQDSSGGDEWQHVNHRNREGVVPLVIRGYRLRCDGAERYGQRATPVVGLRNGVTSLTVACRRFWQNFPKAIEANDHCITLRLFPRQFGDLHELQGGEQKTHHFEVAFADDGVTALPLEWCRSPLLASLPPAWYCEADAIPHMLPRESRAGSEHEGLIDVAVDPLDGFVARRERIDEYGWRNFGDLFADHEAVFDPDSVRVSHYNNQYDAIAGFARQFMRTGDVRWWGLMDDLARHVADIDIYHTDGDKSAYNHGLFWHTSHYVDAGRSTHRAYPRAPGVFGGGMSNEHNYAMGLVLHHWLTGDPITARAGEGLGSVGRGDGRRGPHRLPLADTGTAPGWPLRRRLPITTARDAGLVTRYWRCWPATN